MPADRPSIAPRLPSTRSAVSNGKRPFASADGRSSGARLLRDRERDLAETLGGMASLSPGEKLRVQACALVSCRVEQLRSAVARGAADVVSDEDLVRITGRLSRELAALDRLAAAKCKAAPAPAGLHAYLEGKARRAEAVA